MWLLKRFLADLIQHGTLTLKNHRGYAYTFGDGSGSKITVRLHDRAIAYKIALHPELYVGEAYMDGRLTLEEGSLAEFLDCVMSNLEHRWHRVQRPLAMLVRCALAFLQEHNRLSAAQRNVAHHYNLSDDLYALFLDPARQYSCAYFETPGDSLEMAQQAKMRHIAKKLLLAPGQRVLDIGSGWGGLSMHLAETAHVSTHGITLSTEQLAYASQAAKQRGLSNICEFELRDYRETEEQYNRIVSVGMFEHVGRPNYRTYFQKIADLLTDDGVALIHTIGHFDGPSAGNPWISKYIFPGGYCPSLSEIIGPIESAGLVITDVEVLRLHYAETLRHWRTRFEAQWDKARALYDERFCRMWEFYLCICEMAFRYGGQTVFQIQLAKRQDAVPLTRNYLYSDQAEHAVSAPQRQWA